MKEDIREGVYSGRESRRRKGSEEEVFTNVVAVCFIPSALLFPHNPFQSHLLAVTPLSLKAELMYIALCPPKIIQGVTVRSTVRKSSSNLMGTYSASGIESERDK